MSLLPCEPPVESGRAWQGAGVWGTGLPQPPSTRHTEPRGLVQTREGPLSPKGLPRLSTPPKEQWAKLAPSPYLQRFLLALVPLEAIPVPHDKCPCREPLTASSPEAQRGEGS